MKRSKPTRKAAKAFTLVELLIVIAIIAILAAMLLPVLGRAKETGKKANCLSNLHQMGMAMHMYADDNDGWIPRGENPYWWHVYVPALGGRSTNDLRSARVFRCPSYPAKGGTNQLICYVVNSWSFAGPQDMTGYQLKGRSRLMRVQRPSDTIYFADNENGFWRPYVTELGGADPVFVGSMNRNDIWREDHLPSGPDGTSLDSDYGRRVSRTRHGPGPNVLFFDGHAKTRKWESITVDEWREVR